MKKRLISLFLAIIMVFGMMPSMVFAAGTEEPGEAPETVPETTLASEPAPTEQNTVETELTEPNVAESQPEEPDLTESDSASTLAVNDAAVSTVSLAADQIGISKASCTVIGSYQSCPVYYLDASGKAGATSVVLTDYVADDIMMIAGVKSNAMVMDTNEAPLSSGYSKTKEAFAEDTNWVFDTAHPLSGLGDNLYAYWVSPYEDDDFYIIVNAYKAEAPAPAAPSFTASVSGAAIAPEKIEKQADAYEYTMYEQDAQGNWNPVQRTIDLYVLTVPTGTKTVDFTFSSACLAYGYDDDKYTCTEGMDEYSGGMVGKTTATRSVDKDGDGNMDFVTVQSPYDANYVSISFYAVSFRYENAVAPLTAESVAVTSIHQDASAGNPVTLTFDEASKTFSGKLSNYTDLPAYNDADISIVLTGLEEGASVVLNNEAGEKIADFVDGTVKTTGNAVANFGKHTFQIVLGNGGTGQTYTLVLEKIVKVQWLKLAFEGIPAFSDTSYYGQPEGTLFQLDENGNRTGKTGVSADCLHYEVYVGPQTTAVKPGGSSGLKIYQNSFRPNANYKTNIYKDDELLFSGTTPMALAMAWYRLKDGAELAPWRTVIRAEFNVNDTEVINSTITFEKQIDLYEDLVFRLEKLDEKSLVYPDDAGKVKDLQNLYATLSEEDKTRVPEELKKKLEHAAEIMEPGRVPEKLEIVKQPAKLEYVPDSVFDPSGVELLATYADGTTRTITTASDGFSVEPTGSLTDETEVIFIYNTARVAQPITIISMGWKGEGTAQIPYELAAPEDLQALNIYVSSGKTTEGLYFKVVADITLPDGWQPIGVLNDQLQGRFCGTIDGAKADGGCYTISVPAGGLPLLGYVKGATVKNLNIYGPQIAGYGLINNMEGVGLSGSAVVIDNITLKSGTQTLKSGLVGSVIKTNPFAGVSAGFVTTIRNCTIEEGCVIGYNADQSEIGSFAGRFQGTIENCVSYATVRGKNSVGGIIGVRDNALGNCTVNNCTFCGTVEGTKNVGGIVGSGYTNATAPNGVKITVMNCKSNGTVKGTENVGGIIGGDEYVVQAWNGYSLKDNSFTGKVSGTTNVGGIIGYYGSLNKCDNIIGNYYSADCSAEKGIGFVKYVDTSCETHETESGATYFNTANGTPGISGVTKEDLNRADDPLGADAAKLCYTDSTPVTATELKVSGDYKAEYITGEALDLSGMVLTVVYNDGSTKVITLDDVTVSKFDPQKVGEQELTLSYGGLTAMITVRVKNPEGQIQVTISLLGDSAHGGNGAVHTYSGGGLITWAGPTKYTVDSNATVWTVLKMLLTEKGYSYSNPSGNYVEAINGLAEMTNGKDSGWMYTLNGTYPKNGVNQQYLKDGDVIVFHYTDDYTKESHGFPAEDDNGADKVDKLIADIGKVTLTDACKNKINAARKAYDALSAADKKKVEKLSVLEAAEASYARLKKADDEKKAADVESLIDKIDQEITLDSEKAIRNARSAYNKLTADQKKLVKKLGKLTRAERDLAELKATEDDKKKAQDVADMIGKLGDVTLASEEAIQKARSAYDKLTDTQKALVTNYDVLEAAEETLTALKERAIYEDAYKTTGDYLEKLGTPNVGSVGGEWMVIGLARSDRDVSDDYYKNASAYVLQNIDENQRLHSAKSTDNSRLILALTAMGKDVTDVEGHDLLAGLNDMNYIQKQGINGPIWALIAFDSGNYPTPDGNVTRDALIQAILDAQLDDGGWALSGEDADPDMTGMALQALAPYCKTHQDVQAAADKGVEALSRMQNADGGYSGIDGASSESAAQVIVALTALGIDPDADERFKKNDISALDALLQYYVQDGGFKHVLTGNRDGMATEQGYYALTAYARFLDSKTSLYNMTDVIDRGGDVADVSTETEPTQQTLPTQAVPAETEPAQTESGGFPWWIVIVVLVVGGVCAAVTILIPKFRKSGRS